MSKIEPIDEPPIVTAIKCRLRQNRELGFQPSIPADELQLLLDIVGAAWDCVRELDPTATDKRKGRGTGVGRRAAVDRLIRIVRTQLCGDESDADVEQPYTAWPYTLHNSEGGA